MRADCVRRANVTLAVNGETLQELQTEMCDGDAMGASTFIESVNGAAFAVDVKLSKEFDLKVGSLDFVVYLDGKFMGGSVIQLNTGRAVAKLFEVHDNIGAREGSRRFSFARQDATIKRPSDIHKERLCSPGEVKVTLTRCRVVWDSKRPTHGPGRDIVGEERLPHKDLRGRSISYRDAKGHQRPQLHDTPKPTCRVTHPLGKKPLATYIFKCRSRKDLQTEGIIERSPTPLENRDPNSLTQEEAAELLCRMRDLQIARETDGSREHPIDLELPFRPRRPTTNTDEEAATKIKNEPKGKQRAKRPHSDVEADGDDEDEDEEGVTITSIVTRTMKRAKVVRKIGADAIDLTED